MAPVFELMRNNGLDFVALLWLPVDRQNAPAQGAGNMIDDERKEVLKHHLHQIRTHLIGVLDLIESELGGVQPNQRQHRRRGAVTTAAEFIDLDDQDPLNDRHCWILTQLGQGVKLTRKQVMDEFGYSVRHSKRLLGALTARGLIRYESTPRPGYYVLCGKTSRGQHRSAGSTI
jgi:hypothetical protein